jgi:protein-disulfide isomerase
MAKQQHRPSARPGTSRTTSSASRRKRRARRQQRRARAWQWGLVVGVVVIAGAVGIAVQASRSKTENAKVVVPKAAMGPQGSVIEGKASAPVLLEEYGDFQCPVCKEFHDVMNATIQRLVAAGTIRFAFHPLNVIDSHSSGSTESVRSAAASLCANDAGKFEQYYDLLYEQQSPTENSGFLTDDRLVAFGATAGLSGAPFHTFETCVRDHTYEGYVLKYADIASQAPRNVSGTPTIFANGRQVQLADLASGASLDPKKLEAVVRSA